jgi:hypothetical protein
MNALIEIVNNLKSSPIRNLIDKRTKEFEIIGN